MTENTLNKAIEKSKKGALAITFIDSGTVTYKDISLSISDVVYIKKVEIIQEPGEHAMMHVEAVLDSDIDENDFQGIQDYVYLTYRNNSTGENKILFYGMIHNISLCREGDGRILYLEAWDATRQMDISPRSRVFQDTNMMLSQLVSEVMAVYYGSDYMINFPDKPIGQLVVQYEETDWEFLKRLFSKYHTALYPDTTHPAARFLAGLSLSPEDFTWDELAYEISQDFNWLKAMKENGFHEMMAVHSVSYSLESYDIAAIGSQITYKNNAWYLAGVKRYLSEGNLVNKYCLRQKEGLNIIPYYNQKITGTSINGTIAAVKRDKVQVQLEIDTGGTSGSGYLFPFSTVASSSDGSGWYCMPEPGESIRVYFPVDDEKEGYVITNIKGREPEAGNPSDPMGNPGVRSISTNQNNHVKFTEEGVVISTGEDQGSVLINKDGSVVIDGLLDITITAAESIQIVAGNDVVLNSQTLVRMENDAGADLEIKSGEIGLHGMMIYEN